MMKTKTWMWLGGVVCVLVLGRAAASEPTITVRSSISGSTLSVTVTGSNGVTCSGNCCQASAGTVDFVYETNNNQFLYVTNSSGTVSTTPSASVSVTSSSPASVDFSVVGAQSSGTGLLWHDPIIIVQTGTCGDGDDGVHR